MMETGIQFGNIMEKRVWLIGVVASVPCCTVVHFADRSLITDLRVHVSLPSCCIVIYFKLPQA